MDSEARSLAQKLLNSVEDSYTAEFPVTRGGTETGEVIVVYAVKTTTGKGNVIKEFIEKRFNPSASGNVCGCCGGTGRQ